MFVHDYARVASEALDRACKQLEKAKEEYLNARVTARAVEFARIDVVLAQLYIDEILAHFEALEPDTLQRLVESVHATVALTTSERPYLQALAKRTRLHAVPELRVEYTGQFEEFENALALLEAAILNPSEIVLTEDIDTIEIDGDDEAATEEPSAAIRMAQQDKDGLAALVLAAQSQGNENSFVHCITFLCNALIEYTNEIKFACHLWGIAQ